MNSQLVLVGKIWSKQACRFFFLGRWTREAETLSLLQTLAWEMVGSRACNSHIWPIAYRWLRKLVFREEQSRHREGRRYTMADIIVALPQSLWVLSAALCMPSPASTSLVAHHPYQWLSEDWPWVPKPPIHLESKKPLGILFPFMPLHPSFHRF